MTGPGEPPAAVDPLAARLARGTRTAQLGLLVNFSLAIVKRLAGIFGNSYALIADAIESSGDVFSSILVWRGLRVSARPVDERYPFGYGKAEPMAAATVGLMLIVAAVVIALESIQDETAQALEHYKGLCRRAENAPDPDAADAEASQAYGDYLELRRQIAGYEKAAEEAYEKLEAGRAEERTEFECEVYHADNR